MIRKKVQTILIYFELHFTIKTLVWPAGDCIRLKNLDLEEIRWTCKEPIPIITTAAYKLWRDVMGKREGGSLGPICHAML